jgi:hypothetical protein
MRHDVLDTEVGPRTDGGPWLGAVTWEALLPVLRSLPITAKSTAAQWSGLLDVATEDGDFARQRAARTKLARRQLRCWNRLARPAGCTRGGRRKEARKTCRQGFQRCDSFRVTAADVMELALESRPPLTINGSVGSHSPSLRARLQQLPFRGGRRPVVALSAILLRHMRALRRTGLSRGPKASGCGSTLSRRPMSETSA